MSRRKSVAGQRRKPGMTLSRKLGIMVGVPVLIGCAVVAGGFAAIAARSPAVTVAPRVAAVARTAPAPVKLAPTPVVQAPEPVDTRFVVKHILSIDHPMRQGEYYWDETGAPAGQVVVTVDLAAQTLSIFRAGYEIGTAVIIFGAEEHPTPLGIFPITQKDADHVSNLYDAPMPYMLRLTNGGISIHGSEVGNGYVTHGCVGIPKAFARKLFDAVKLGDKVIVSRGEMLTLGDPITAA
jgi:lipoprotein-anchoring transpeptidase ErfK/SrfK